MHQAIQNDRYGKDNFKIKFSLKYVSGLLLIINLKKRKNYLHYTHNLTWK